MWKAVAIVLALVLLGHLAVRYLRRNPLAPEVEGHQVLVTTQSYTLRFQQSGPVGGTYFIVSAESRDYGEQPMNALLWVIDAGYARDYMRSFPDFHLYGSESSERMRNVASPLAIVAATSRTYSDLVSLVDDHESRSSGRGERLCAKLSGTALAPDSATTLDTGAVEQGTAERLLGDTPLAFIDKLEVDDCVKLLAEAR